MGTNQSPPPAGSGQTGEQPTRVRFGVLVYLCLLSFILYLDRLCISQAGPAIKAELGLSQQQLGYVFASFTIAYGIFMAAAGRLGDRFGSRGVLVIIVIWWSVFTALTGACTGLLMLIAVRFIFGAAEAGALPNCARVLTHWFPVEKRGVPQGLLQTTALVGGAVAPFIVAQTMYLLDEKLAPFFREQFGYAPIGWRWTFLIFGLLGFVWAAVFWRFFRDNPHEDPRVNAAERALIRGGGRADEKPTPQPPVPWGLVLRSPNIWLLGFIMSCSSFVSYYYFSWLPTYLQSGRHVEAVKSGELASRILVAGAIGSLLGGFLIDWVMRRTGGWKRSRSVIGAAATGLAGFALLGSLSCDDAAWATNMIALSFFVMMLMIAPWWGAVGDISGRHVATLFGLMNSMGIVGAAGSQIFMGAMADHYKSQGLSGREQWDPPFYYLVAALFIGAVAWLFVNPNKSAVEETKTEPAVLE